MFTRGCIPSITITNNYWQSLNIIASWWFGTCGLFFHSVGNAILTIDELIFFRGVGSTINQFGIQVGFGYQLDMNWHQDWNWLWFLHARVIILEKYGDFLHGGSPKWMVYNGTSYLNRWFRGTPILGNLHMFVSAYQEHSFSICEPWMALSLYRKWEAVTFQAKNHTWYENDDKVSKHYFV